MHKKTNFICIPVLCPGPVESNVGHEGAIGLANDSTGGGVDGVSGQITDGVLGTIGGVGSNGLDIVGPIGFVGTLGSDIVTGQPGNDGPDGATDLGFNGNAGPASLVQNTGEMATSVLGTSVYAYVLPDSAGCPIPVWDGTNLQPLTFSGGTNPIKTILTVPLSQQILIRVTFRIFIFGSSALPGTLLLGFHNADTFTSTPSYGYYAQTYNRGRDCFVFDFMYDSTVLPAAGTNLVMYLMSAVELPAGISQVLVTSSWYRTYGVAPPTPTFGGGFPPLTIVVIDLNGTLVVA